MASWTRYRTKGGRFAKKGKGRREKATRYGTTNRTTRRFYKLKRR